MSLATLKGQAAVAELLKRSLKRERLAHAYLFVGDRGSGKEDVARELAKAVNCTAGKGDACDECLSCRKIDAGNHPDVQWIRPESKSRRITIDQIRELMRSIYLKPSEGKMKVAILVDAECLQQEAANAFLKTLEEPAANSTLLLLASSPEQLLETILSRCLRIQFASTGVEKLNAVQEKVVELLAEVMSQGNDGTVGRTYRLLGEIMGMLKSIREAKESEVSARMQLEKYADADPDYREKVEKELEAAVEAEYRQARADLLRAFSVFFRDLNVLASGADKKLLLLPENEAVLRKIASGYSAEWLTDRIEIVEDIQANLRQNINEALALEVGLLKIFSSAPQTAAAA
jgi:DNA polymerase-3 subunit delta'